MLFIGAFLALTLLPGIQMLTRIASDEPVNEQRFLAPEPKTDDLSKLPARANAWFSDHFGLRSLMIRIKAEIDYRVFRFSDRVHIGKDGYLFYRNTLDNNKPTIERKLEAAQPAMVRNLQHYAEALDRKGIRLIVSVNLLGDRFFPEKLPDDVASRTPLRRIDSFIEQIAAIPNLTFIDTTALLRADEKVRPIFHRTDFHWNDPASFSTAKAMVAEIGRIEGRAQSPWSHELKYDTREFSGGVALFMPLFHPLTEVSIFTHDNWKVPKGFKRDFNVGAYEKVTTSDPSNQGLLPKTYVIGDSFMDCIERNGFSEYFAETYRLRWGPNLTVSKITEAIPHGTRSMVWQFIEVNQPVFDGLANTADVDDAIAILEGKER
ncbi:alginate O-acetyltransferase AlgX-related protein [Variovorax sp. Sphag1AA]|uniref:alginate O-acetyltransferase AlgX-related protein n=1 Tax=Variovorax sp. Sphag1AA TaxID=2587027 RepID=UPI00161B55E0|nr:hypothetical protein [Variovorax sp. Sphag1AA]MBB3179825.1 hypothetical protein [Variovorax sp. Sphag1AA]